MKVRGLLAYHRTLLRHYGPQEWWPAETEFEVMVGAILTQNTAWTHVERALRILKDRRLLDPHRIRRISAPRLAPALRSAGYFNVKARRLKNLVEWFVGRHGGDVSRLKRMDPGRLREELLEVTGVGPETADTILLYALGFPTLVVDTYTRRVLSRHRLVPQEASYAEAKAAMESSLPAAAPLYNEFHALLVSVGKEFCRTVPKCDGCPLRTFLPRARRSRGRRP